MCGDKRLNFYGGGESILCENWAVAWISERFSLKLGIPPDKARLIRNAALTHDIGKLKISESILGKRSRLTHEEFWVIKTHVEIGAQMLSTVKGEAGIVARSVALLHHEWHNGNGYLGVPACRLPDYVPIVAIADVFCALRYKRSYKKVWPLDEALGYLKKQAGSQFSPDLVREFNYFAESNLF